MAQFSKQELYAKITAVPIIPLFNYPDLDICKSVLKACYNGGIRVFEYTNRGESAAEIFADLVKYTRKAMPEMAIGIGTVFNAQQAEFFVNLDTDFIVQPILDAGVGKVCQQHEIAWMPGTMTFTEIYTAQQLGADIVKIFPANILGTAFIKAMKGPMPNAKVMVTGGVEPNAENLKSWFSAGVTCVGMGSQLFPKSLFESGDYSSLERQVRECISIVKGFEDTIV